MCVCVFFWGGKGGRGGVGFFGLYGKALGLRKVIAVVLGNVR